GALKPLSERLYHGGISRREESSGLEGDIQAQPSTQEQCEGLSLARKRHGGGGRLWRRADVGLVTFYDNIPRLAGGVCERKPIPEWAGYPGRRQKKPMGACGEEIEEGGEYVRGQRRRRLEGRADIPPMESEFKEASMSHGVHRDNAAGMIAGSVPL